MEKPLQTKEEQDKLIQAYANHSSFYSGLVKSNCDQKIKGKYNEADCDQFYALIFHDWKKALRILIENNYVKPEYKDQLFALYRYVSGLKPKTRDEVMQIMDYESIKDETLRAGMESFRWNAIGEFSGWNHIHSNCVNYGLSKKQVVKHRLYLNCDSTVTHRIMLRFIQKCNAKRSAYYFKYDSYGDRDDNLVFYCDTEHLSSYIEILKEIVREENLRSHVYEPPLCTATIDGWMGYGSEPYHEDEEDRTSFNQKREELMEKCIKEESGKWLLSHIDTHLFVNGRDVPYKYVFISCVVEETVKNYLNATTNSEYCKKNKGYTLDDLKNVDLRSYVYGYLMKNFDKVLAYYKNPEAPFRVEFPFQKGTLSFNKKILEEVRKKQVKFYWEHSDRFQKQLMNQIHSAFLDHGIDPDNFACETYVMEELGKPKSQKDSIKIDVSPSIRSEESFVSNRRTKSGYTYMPMTEEEIKKSQSKLGF